MGGLKEIAKIILAVLGLVSAYPDVTYDNLITYWNFDKNIINTQFRAYNMINQPIRDIIDSGIDVNIIYQIKTRYKNKIVYEGTSIRRISYHNNTYSVNGKGNFDLNILTNVISVNEMAILTNASNYIHQSLRTDIELLINCDATPDIINLWGKRSPITFSYIPENPGE